MNDKKIRIILLSCIIILIFVLYGLIKVEKDRIEFNKEKYKYEITIYNETEMLQKIYCDKYERLEHSYKLYDKNNKLLYETFIANSIIIEIKSNYNSKGEK